MKRLFYLLLLCIIFLNKPIEVRAETSEDLLKIYGKSYDLPDTSDTEDSIANIQDTIDTLEAMKAKHEEYNKALDDYNKLQREKLNAANKDVGILSRKNKAIAKEIEDNLVTAEWDYLMGLDSEYKANFRKMNEIAESMNSISFMTEYKFTEYDISSLEYQLLGLEEELAISIEAEEIGDVTNIEWILANDMKVTSKFGYRLDPITKDRVTFHSGTDYRASNGTALKALFKGTVIDCGYSSSAGKYITVLVNDRIKYFVCHLSEIKVEKGDVVDQYQLIGLTGNTGSRTTGPHLHLALYIDGVAVDVAKIFK